MTCDIAEESIDAVASGEPVAEAVRVHIESCARCAASLAMATRIDRALRAAPAVRPPERFTTSVIARIRRERWRADQHIDWVFNLAVGLAIAVVAVGGLALLNSGSVTAWIVSMSTLIAEGLTREAPAQAPPPLWSYVLACGLLGTAVAVWRWAEGPKP